MVTPQVGDIVHIRANAPSVHAGAHGVVSRLRFDTRGRWSEAELLLDSERLWVGRDAIDEVLKERNPFRREPGPNRPPCRLYGLLAREAPVGVILRRGPTRWVQMIRWDTATDAFEPGQWFHGRVYERRGGLSPDGTRLIYFAAKMTGRRSNFYAWTAISKPPYFTAVALWPKAIGTWFGGGLFLNGEHVWLNHLGCEAEPDPDHQPPPGLAVTVGTHDPRYDGGYYRRLEQDGWRVDPDWWQRYAPDGFVTAPRAWHTKPHPRHPFQLVMHASVYYSYEPAEFAVQRQGQDDLEPLDGMAWADWDQRGRLVCGRDGQVLAAEVSEAGLQPLQVLADFNSHRPEPIEAPEWATRW